MNALQQYLEQVGLPWRESRAELTARNGLTRCHWSLAEVVEVGLALPPFPGLLRPLQFRHAPALARHMPPTFFSASADPCGHAMRNLEAVARAVAAQLGPGEYDDGSVNARGYAWRSGPAELRLYCFPPKLQDRHRGENEWHQREPRLREACYIGIDTGYRPPLSAEEREWVAGFAPALALHPRIVPPPEPPPQPRQPGLLDRLLGARSRPAPADLRPAWANPAQAHVGSKRAAEPGLEYAREPPPEVERVFGRLGATPGGEALVWCDDQLRVVPRAHVKALRLDRYEPERGIGDGEALLTLQCQPPGEDRRVEAPLARRYGMASLDVLAHQVADWLAMPLESRDVW